MNRRPISRPGGHCPAASAVFAQIGATQLVRPTRSPRSFIVEASQVVERPFQEPNSTTAGTGAWNRASSYRRAPSLWVNHP